MKLEQKEYGIYVSQPKNSGKGIQLRLIKMKYVQVLGLDTALSPALEDLMLESWGFHRGQNIR